MIRRPQRSPLFPSTTLFRSLHVQLDCLLGLMVSGVSNSNRQRDLLARRDARRHCQFFYNPAARVDVFFQVRRRSEEHTSELQSRSDLVCRLLLEKKKKKRSHADPADKRHIATSVRLSIGDHTEQHGLSISVREDLMRVEVRTACLTRHV